MSERVSVRVTFYFLFTLLVVACIVLFFEVYFRISDQYGNKGVTWIPSTGVTGIEYSPTEIWRWRKNMNDKITNSEGQTFVVHTDKFGFRNYGKSVRKPKNVIRILVLGDSYTEALGVADDHTFAALLEKKLSNIKPNDKTIEVVSASSPGWGTDQEFGCLQNEAMEFEPDYVLLMACPNDIREAWCKKFAVMTNEGIKFNQIKLSRAEIFLWCLSNTSRTYQFLQQKVFHTGYGSFAQLRSHYSFTFGRDDTNNWDRPLFLIHPFPEVDGARILFDTLIKSMHILCKQKRIHFAVSLTPTLMEFNGGVGADTLTRSGLVSDMLHEFCQSEGIDYVDLYDHFRTSDNASSYYLSSDHHYNDKGHILIADILSDYYRHNMGN